MRKNSNKVLFVMAWCIIVMLTSCQTGTEEPAIKITSNAKVLHPIYYGDFQLEKEDIEKSLKEYMIGKRFIDLPTVQYGDSIKIEALNYETVSYEIYDYILDEKGNIISQFDNSPSAISSAVKGKAEFSFVEQHEFESYANYSIEGKLIHTILIKCMIGKADFTFATLVLSEDK